MVVLRSISFTAIIVALPPKLVRVEHGTLFTDARVDHVAAAAFARRKTRRLRAVANEWNDASPATADAARKRFFERELHRNVHFAGNARNGAQHRRWTAREDHVRAIVRLSEQLRNIPMMA